MLIVDYIIELNTIIVIYDSPVYSLVQKGRLPLICAIADFASSIKCAGESNFERNIQHLSFIE